MNFKSFDLLTGRKVAPELGAGKKKWRGKKSGEWRNLHLLLCVLNLRRSLDMWVGQGRGQMDAAGL